MWTNHFQSMTLSLNKDIIKIKII